MGRFKDEYDVFYVYPDIKNGQLPSWPQEYTICLVVYVYYCVSSYPI